MNPHYCYNTETPENLLESMIISLEDRISGEHSLWEELNRTTTHGQEILEKIVEAGKQLDQYRKALKKLRKAT